MGYNTQTVQELMSLVDDHKEELKEATYIQVCNAIQELHRQASRPTPPPLQRRPAPTPPLQRAPAGPPPSQVPIPTITRTDTRFDPWESDAAVQMERHRIHAIRSQIRGIQDCIDTTTVGNVKLEDKYKVLSTMFEYTGPQRNADVTAFFKQLQRARILTGVRFKELCINEKMARYERLMVQYHADLSNAQSEQAEARQRLVRAVNNRTPWV
jgi:hypothetical protein